MSSITKSVLTLVVVVSGVVGVIAAKQQFMSRHFLVKAKDGHIEKVSLDGLEKRQFVDMTTDKPVKLEFSHPFTLLVFLSGSECRACLDEATVWGQLSRLEPRTLQVIAIGVNTTKGEVESVRRAHSTEFPYLRFQNESDEAALGIGSVTPLKVLVDQRGVLRLVAGPAGDRKAHEEFSSRVKAEVLHPKR